MIIFEQQLWMKEFIASTDKIIDEIFENTGSIEFRDILKSQHHGGKRLRPLIVAATSRLNCQSNDPPAHYAAVIVELLHLASLFHDDILDGTTIRRNNPTAQTQIGSSKAVLVGDYLLAELFQIAFQKFVNSTNKMLDNLYATRIIDIFIFK